MIKKAITRLIRSKKVNAGDRKILSVHFDSAYYLENNIDVKVTGIDPVEHYLLFGDKENREPSPRFSPTNYRDNHQLAKADNSFIHYLKYGQYESSALLDMEEFKLLSNDEKGHYLHQYELLKPFFDKKYYCENYGIDEKRVDPLFHYLFEGWKSFKNPSSQFSTSKYLESYEDVKSAGVNPLYHYVVSGYDESRDLVVSEGDSAESGAVESNAEESEVASDEHGVNELSYVIELIKPHFDANYYKKMYPEVNYKKITPLEHYIVKGWKELKNPNADFSTKFYLEDNPDVVDAKINPFYHFIAAGINERRFPKRPGGVKSEIIYNLMNLEAIAEKWKCFSKSPELLSKEMLLKEFSGLKENTYLSVSHDVYLNNVGGVQICVALEERAALDKSASYLHLAPYQPLPTLASTDEESLLVHISLNGVYLGIADLTTIEKLLPSNKNYTAILHALHGHSPELLKSLFNQINLSKCYLWVHDYFTVCEGYNLLRNTVSYCDAPKVESKACGVCIYGKTRKSHMHRIDTLLEGINIEAIAPSNVAKNIWLKAIKGRSSLEKINLNVVEHIQFTNEQQRASTNDRKLKIAFLGYPSFHKGGEEFAKLAEQLVTNDSVELYHIGQNPTEDSTIKFVECKVSQEKPYAMIETVRAQDIDYVFIPALWPETFNITCYEAIAAGTKVITYPSSGNVASYIRNNELGVEVENIDELLDMINGEKLLPISQKIDRQVKYSKMTMECENKL